MRVRPLSVTTAVEVCSVIHGRDMALRDLPGAFVGNPSTKRAIYTPPTGAGALRDKLQNWEQFIHSSAALDPIVRMAIAHYQFEAIHPFPDGNGRTGRILNTLLLINDGLLHQPILYLSRYIIEHKSDYYRLAAPRRHDPWLVGRLDTLHDRRTAADRRLDRGQNRCNP